MEAFEEKRQGLMQAESAGDAVVEDYTALLKEMQDFWANYHSRLNS